VLGQVTEIWVGALLALALVPIAVRVLFSWDRARTIKRFPELDRPETQWPRVRDWLAGRELTVEASREQSSHDGEAP
jgi:hypothetical protein